MAQKQRNIKRKTHFHHVRARRDCMILRWWGEVNERARARGHARLRADEHGRVVYAHSIFFELRRKGVAGHRPRALLVWGVPHQISKFSSVLGV